MEKVLPEFVCRMWDRRDGRFNKRQWDVMLHKTLPQNCVNKPRYRWDSWENPIPSKGSLPNSRELHSCFQTHSVHSHETISSWLSLADPFTLISIWFLQILVQSQAGKLWKHKDLGLFQAELLHPTSLSSFQSNPGCCTHHLALFKATTLFQKGLFILKTLLGLLYLYFRAAASPISSLL